MQGTTVAITGTTGFLGSAVAERFAREGAEIRSLVRNPPGAPGEVFAGDLRRGGWEADAFAGADVVVHCAAALGGPLHHQRLINRDGTAAVAAAARQAGVGRFIHVSSIAVYGYRGTEFPETRPVAPSQQAYSTTKAEAEEAVGREYPGATIIRPGGIFGPGARFWSAGFAKRARRLLAFNIGRGRGTLPVVYVEDVADLVAVAAADGAARGEAFNCVLDPSPTWRRYQSAYAAIVGRDRWISLPVWPARAIAAGMARVARDGSNASVMDELLAYALTPKRFPMDKARRLLGWAPRFDLEQGVAATAPWLRDQGLI